jgi:hypothetical protein
MKPNIFYRPQDDELRNIAAVQTLAKWRHEGRGPPYHEAGRNILYLGADVLAWLEGRKVVPSRH